MPLQTTSTMIISWEREDLEASTGASLRVVTKYDRFHPLHIIF